MTQTNRYFFLYADIICILKIKIFVILNQLLWFKIINVQIVKISYEDSMKIY